MSADSPVFAAVLAAALAVFLAGAPAGARAEPGEASAEATAALGRKPGEGTILGQVFDSETGLPVKGVTVIISWPEPDGAGESRQEVRVTGEDGAYGFASIPPGSYDIGFIKSGYRASTMKNFPVQPDQLNRADFPLPSLPPEAFDEILELDAFVVEASTVEEFMPELELRMDSDTLLNTMSAEDLSKFAAGDVASALKRVVGVTVVEGQFAVIRGLDDRYNSTLYNAAPVPSPDPDRQSVQLDLFPSEIVSNLVIAKTFAPNLPSNSAGGSIDIVTHDYPEVFELKLKGGAGFNSRARDRFFELKESSPIGTEADTSDVTESEFGVSLAGRLDLVGRELRYKGVFNSEIDYETAEGYKQKLEPNKSATKKFPKPERVVTPGGMGLGILPLTGGHFDRTESTREEQDTSYLGLGFDLDREGRHTIDGSIFYTRKQEEEITFHENGHLPGYDYEQLAQKEKDGQQISGTSEFQGFATNTTFMRDVRQESTENPSEGPLWFTSLFESESFDNDRDLLVNQISGDHRIGALEGLHLSWRANYAKTSQQEQTLGTRFFFEPSDEWLEQLAADPNLIPSSFPVSVSDLGPGGYAANKGFLSNKNDIDETQGFYRFDLDYETSLFELLALKLSGGIWHESASREVDSRFLDSPSREQSTQFAIEADTPEELGDRIFRPGGQGLDFGAGGQLSGSQTSFNNSEREIDAWSLGATATLWDRLDLIGGVRREDIRIESNNDPFTGESKFGVVDINPTRHLLFDRLDNPDRGEVTQPPPEGTTFNDQLLGIAVPVDAETGLVDLTEEELQGLINGLIDESRSLPSLGVAYRPLDGLTLRGVWSKTVARPSFREMGYYLALDPDTGDRVIGNPQLKLSDVESWDARIEYTWGKLGDLFAISGFTKTIEQPLESIVVRDPLNFEGSGSALYRTFFNNPNEADLRGFELEARKNLGFLGFEFAEYTSVGGNYTFIDAEVDRIAAELERAQVFFPVTDDDLPSFTYLEPSRRLFGQPEWIANFDITFDHPGWGTKITLAYFSISDILDAAGSVTIGPNGDVVSYTPDRYHDSFHQLDLILSQSLGNWRFKASLKNLTDDERRLIYDPYQLNGTWTEREKKLGRDFSFSVSYAFSF